MQEVIKKLMEKRGQEENIMNLYLEDTDSNNILEKCEETLYTKGRIKMIDDIIFFLENNVWEDEISAIITKN